MLPSWLTLERAINAVLAIAAATVFFYARHEAASEATQKEQRKQQVETLQEDLRIERKASAAAREALSARAESTARIQYVTKEIIREVPVYVPAGTPDLPGGWRVLHDAAATGSPPDPARSADAAAVAAQDAAGTVVDNYGTCRDTADQLEKLQQWIRGVTQ